MNFIDSKQRFRIRFESETISLIQISIINRYTHQILNEIAYEAIKERNDLFFLDFMPRPTGSAEDWFLVDAVVERIENGSVVQEVSVFINDIISNQFAVSVLSGIVANFIYALLKAAISKKNVEVIGQTPERDLIDDNRKPIASSKEMIVKLDKLGKPYQIEITEISEFGTNISSIKIISEYPRNNRRRF